MMAYPFRNLVFEGGGVKGIACLGALEEMTARGIVSGIKRIGGTSAGAINALLLGLGFSPERTREILWSLDFHQFMDDSWGLIQDADRLINEFGWYKGDFFRNWAGELIKERTGNSESSFADIESLKEKHGFKSMYFIGTNLSTSFSEVFSPEHTPRMCVADGIRISMSLPLFFAARRSPRGDVYVDGGLLDNYPVKLFDREKYLESPIIIEPAYYARVNERLAGMVRPISRYVYNQETLGFRLDSREQIAMFRDQAQPPVAKIDSFFDYTWALIHTVLESQQNSHLHSDDWARTVYIDSLGVKTTDFDLSAEMKEKLLQSGRSCTASYFEWYDNDEEKPNKLVLPRR